MFQATLLNINEYCVLEILELKIPLLLKLKAMGIIKVSLFVSFSPTDGFMLKGSIS